MSKIDQIKPIKRKISKTEGFLFLPPITLKKKTVQDNKANFCTR